MAKPWFGGEPVCFVFLFLELYPGCSRFVYIWMRRILPILDSNHKERPNVNKTPTKGGRDAMLGNRMTSRSNFRDESYAGGEVWGTLTNGIYCKLRGSIDSDIVVHDRYSAGKHGHTNRVLLVDRSQNGSLTMQDTALNDITHFLQAGCVYVLPAQLPLNRALANDAIVDARIELNQFCGGTQEVAP